MGIEKALEQWFIKKTGQFIKAHGNKTINMDMEFTVLVEENQLEMFIKESFTRINRQDMEYISIHKVMST